MLAGFHPKAHSTAPPRSRYEVRQEIARSDCLSVRPILQTATTPTSPNLKGVEFSLTVSTLTKRVFGKLTCAACLIDAKSPSHSSTTVVRSGGTPQKSGFEQLRLAHSSKWVDPLRPPRFPGITVLVTKGDISLLIRTSISALAISHQPRIVRANLLLGPLTSARTIMLVPLSWIASGRLRHLLWLLMAN